MSCFRIFCKFRVFVFWIIGLFRVFRILEYSMGAFHLRKKPGNFGASESGISDR